MSQRPYCTMPQWAQMREAFVNSFFITGWTHSDLTGWDDCDIVLWGHNVFIAWASSEFMVWGKIVITLWDLIAFIVLDHSGIIVWIIVGCWLWSQWSHTLSSWWVHGVYVRVGSAISFTVRTTVNAIWLERWVYLNKNLYNSFNKFILIVTTHIINRIIINNNYILINISQSVYWKNENSCIYTYTYLTSNNRETI